MFHIPRFRSLLAAALLSLTASGCSAATTEAVSPPSYADNAQARQFVDSMVKEGFERPYLEQLMADARRQESILKAISRPAERRLNWGEYRKIFLGASRISQGVEFWNDHAATLQRASEQYGVAPEVIVAVIGVETRYGRHAGNYRVLDALATLAFDYPPRSRFFSGQLKELLYLLKEEKLVTAELKGSYAGAMGYGQFIPSSYRNFAVDFDGDGQRDLLNNPVDAIGSVANYFNRHGWKAGEAVTLPATVSSTADSSLFNAGLKPVRSLADWQRLGVQPATPLELPDSELATVMAMKIDDRQEHWLGLHNFYVITRYNHSRLYAMAVHQLSQAILAARSAKVGA